MSQYFENDNNLRSQKRLLKCYINNQELHFYSDVGVFSNTKIDYGSFAFLKTLLREDKVSSLLDVGCGYGFLGISLSYFKMADFVDMVDINIRAVKLTQENILLNNVINANCFISDAFINVNKKYQRIIMNPPIRTGKKNIYKMFSDAKEHLLTNGTLFIVIKKDLGANSALKELSNIFTNALIVQKDKGYWIIKAND